MSKKEASVADKAPAELSALLTRMEVPAEIVATKEQGKHVRALEDIKKGQDLFGETPLVWWPFECLYKAPFCAFCSNTIIEPEKAVKCPNCDAIFCCPECEAAGHETHQILCGKETKLREFHVANKGADADSLVPISVESVARCVAVMVGRFRRAITQVAGEEPTVAQVEAVDAQTIRAVFEAAVQPFNRLVEPPLGSEFSEINAQAWCDMVRDTLRDRVELFVYKQSTIADAFLSNTTLNTVLGQLTLNSQAIVREMPTSESNGEKTASIAVAGAVFTLHANFNHSCAPNCEVVFEPDCADITMRATEPIAKGEEICITYIPTLYLATENYVKRRERLQPYLFTCACKKCAAEESDAKKVEESEAKKDAEEAK